VLRWRFITAEDNIFPRWTVCWIVSARQSKINKVVFDRYSRSRVVGGVGLEIGFEMLVLRMETIGEEMGAVHHNVVGITVANR
jgi:hypothetical protein